MTRATEAQRGLENEARIGAISLLTGTLIRTLARSAAYKAEFLGFMDFRYRLTESQRSWCIELLEDDSMGPDRAVNVLEAAGGVLSLEDLLVVSRLFSWFRGAELGGAAYEFSTSNLFPEDVCKAFSALDISPTFVTRNMNAAFRKRITLLHPDRADEPTRRQAEELTVKLLSARSEIINFYNRIHEYGAWYGEDKH